MERPELIVLAWYRREDYDRIYRLAPDGGGMEPTFDDWQKFVAKAMPAIEAQNIPIKKIIVEPDDLATWLETRSLQSTPETRAQFINEVALKRHGTH